MSITEVLVITVPLMFVLLLYFLGKHASPKPRRSSDRDAPYACGEDFPPVRPQMVINFFWYIVIFLIFDVIDFIIALSYNVSPLYPLMYVLIVVLALVIALLYRA